MDAALEPHLAPSRVVEVLDRTFRVYRDNFVLFIGLAALFLVPLNFLQFLVVEYVADERPENLFNQQDYTYDYDTYYNDDPFYYDLVAPMFSLAIGALQILLIYSVITYITSEYYLGRRVTLWEAMAAIRGRLAPLGLALLVLLAIPVGFFLITVVLSQFSGGEVIAGLLTIGAVCALPFLGIVIVYLLWNLLAFLVPVLVLENVGTLRGMNRAMNLAKSRWWQVFWFFFSILVIYWLLLFVLFTIGGIVVGASNDSLTDFIYDANTGTEFRALQAAVTTLIGVLIIPIIPTGMTLLYYDTRIRVEGLDMALQLVDVPEPRPSDLPSPSLEMPFLGGKDITNMVLLVVGTVGSCGAIWGFFYITLILLLT